MGWRVQNEDRTVVPFTGEMEAAPFTYFVKLSALPLTLPFSAANMDRIFGTDISKHCILIAPPKDLAAQSPTYQAFLGAAKRMQSTREFVFVTVDLTNEEGEPVVDFFNVDADSEPVIVAFQIEPDQLKYWCARVCRHELAITCTSALGAGSVLIPQPSAGSEKH